MDFAQARYYKSAHGRFTSIDPVLLSSTRIANPQIWNGYSYAGNNPLRYVDPTGLERIKLGQSEAEIEKEIEKRKAEKKAIEKNKELSKEDRKKQVSEKNGQLKTLDKKLEGTKTVNAMLKALNDVGAQNGLKLSDFTLTTDGKNDFPNLSTKDVETIRGSQAFVVQNTPEYAGTIYIRTDTDQGFYQRYNGFGEDKSDFLYIGGTYLRHEQVHLLFGGGNEPTAFKEQRNVLVKFKNYVGKENYDSYYKIFTAGIGNNP